MAAAGSLRRVRRTPSGLCVEDVQSVSEELAALGMDASDLMGWYRAFMFVEGLHDVAAFSGFLGEELERRRVKVFALRGARNLPGALASQIFLDASSASVVGVLDGLAPDVAARIWRTAIGAFDSDGHDAMRARLAQDTRPLGTEGKAIKEFILEAASKTNHRDRCVILGLPRPDVLLYVHPPFLCEGMPDSWELVGSRRESEAREPYDPVTWKPNKKWLEDTWGFDINACLPRAIARTRAERGVPDDFLTLLRALDGHLGGVGDTGADTAEL
jgi:hypothetical protein